MSTNNTYLAVFLGSKTSPKMKAWTALPEAERRAKEREGIAAWKAWVEKNHGAIVGMGGPLGRSSAWNCQSHELSHHITIRGAKATGPDFTPSGPRPSTGRPARPRPPSPAPSARLAAARLRRRPSYRRPPECRTPESPARRTGPRATSASRAAAGERETTPPRKAR